MGWIGAGDDFFGHFGAIETRLTATAVSCWSRASHTVSASKATDRKFEKSALASW